MHIDQTATDLTPLARSPAGATRHAGMHPALLLALTCLLAIAYAPAQAVCPKGAEWTEDLQSFDVTVNLNDDWAYKRVGGCEDGYDNACEMIQDSLNPWLYDNSAACEDPAASIPCELTSEEKVWRVRVFGETSVYFDDLAELETSPSSDVPYRVCFGILPTNTGYYSGATKTKDYPIVTPTDRGGVSQRLDIFFDGAMINYYAASGQAVQWKPAVIYQQGAGYLVGLKEQKGAYDASVFDSVYESGTLHIRMRDALSGTWAQGKTPAMIQRTNQYVDKLTNLPNCVAPDQNEGANDDPTNVFVESCTTTIGIFTTGFNKGDSSDLRVILSGVSADYDDIGLLHQHSWGRRRVGWRIWGFGTGMVYYGNAHGSMEHSYVSANSVDFSAGDRINGADTVMSTECLSRYCRYAQNLFGLHIESSVFEGAPYGIMNWFEGGYDNQLTHVHMETGAQHTPQRHLFLYGAGSCSNNEQTCADEADCPTGEICEFPATSARTCEYSGAACENECPCYQVDKQCLEQVCRRAVSWGELRFDAGNLPGDAGATDVYGAVFGGGATPKGHVFLNTATFSNDHDDGKLAFVTSAGTAITIDVSDLTLGTPDLVYPNYEMLVDDEAHEIAFRLRDDNVAAGLAGWLSFDRSDPTLQAEADKIMLPNVEGTGAEGQKWWLHKVAWVSKDIASCILTTSLYTAADDEEAGPKHLIRSPKAGDANAEVLGFLLEDRVRLIGVRLINLAGACDDPDIHGKYYFLPLRYSD